MLDWLVLVVPVVLGVVLILVPAKREDPKVHMRWRYALAVSLILYGFLVWRQQSDASRTAIVDRDRAVRDTSAQVSAEVTTVYETKFGEQKRQIEQLQSQLGIFQGQTKASLSVMGKRLADANNAIRSIASASPLKIRALEIAKKIEHFALITTRAADSVQNATDTEREKMWIQLQEGWEKELQSQVNDIVSQLEARNLMENADNVGNSGNGCAFKPKVPADTVLPRRVCAEEIFKAAEKIP
jgi:hypothetical protein